MVYLTENGIYIQLDNIGISYEYSVLDEYIYELGHVTMKVTSVNQYLQLRWVKKLVKNPNLGQKIFSPNFA